ncbi:MAG: hypothetical protein WCS73_05760 [Lentisphaeria bacterium]
MQDPRAYAESSEQVARERFDVRPYNSNENYIKHTESVVSYKELIVKSVNNTPEYPNYDQNYEYRNAYIYLVFFYILSRTASCGA